MELFENKSIFQNYKDCGEDLSVQYDGRVFSIIAVKKAS